MAGIGSEGIAPAKLFGMCVFSPVKVCVIKVSKVWATSPAGRLIGVGFLIDLVRPSGQFILIHLHMHAIQ